jgi:AcrR family transcriptional regulator
VQVLAEDGFDRFSVQRVLAGAEVSRTTLYSHFTDVDTLIEAALVETFARESALLQARFGELIERSTDRASFIEALRAYLTLHGQVPTTVRMRRAHTVSLSTTRPTLATAIAVVQDEVTATWQATIEELQQRGFLRADLDARTMAVMSQAIPLGRITDDVATEQLGDERWTAMWIHVVEHSFVTPED